MPQTIFTAQLPNRHALSFFHESLIRGDGNCGFKLLGITRDEFADTLIPFAHDAEIRASIWKEIREAIDLGDFVGPSTEGQTCCSTIQRLEDECQPTLVAIARRHGLDYTQQLDIFILALDELGHTDDAESLRQAHLDIERKSKDAGLLM